MIVRYMFNYATYQITTTDVLKPVYARKSMKTCFLRTRVALVHITHGGPSKSKARSSSSR